MSVSRRKFLRSGAVVSAALVLKPSAFALGDNTISSDSAASIKNRVNSYTREAFEPYVGETFRVRLGQQVVDLKLVALVDQKPASGTDGFSLRFDALKPLPPTAHTLNHRELGEFDLFMVQSKVGSRFSQLAIVNHVA